LGREVAGACFNENFIAWSSPASLLFEIQAFREVWGPGGTFGAESLERGGVMLMVEKQGVGRFLSVMALLGFGTLSRYATTAGMTG